MPSPFRYLVFFLIVFILFICVLTPDIYALKFSNVYVGSLSVSAESAVLIDASDNTLLFSKNADVRMPMASTTKIMTAIVAIENGNIDSTVTIHRDAVGIEGSSIYLYAGEKLTLRQLLYALMLESANDAAVAIAIEIGGNVETFSKMMNDKANELGLKNTHFVNPHGLDNENHYTTARELAIIAADALKNEIFREIVSTQKITIPLNETEGVRLLINHNKMLQNYNGAIGVKTGFTKRCGRCLVSAAEREGLQLVAVTLNAPNDWNDHKNMLDYGFASYVHITLAKQNTYRLVLPVTGGNNSTLVCTNTKEIKTTLPLSHGEITCIVEAPRFIIAPVTEGDYIGKISYYCEGKLIGESPLSSVSTISATTTKSGFWNFILRFLGLNKE